MKKTLIGLVILMVLGVGGFFGYRQYRIATFVPPEPAIDENGLELSTTENFYREKPPFVSNKKWIETVVTPRGPQDK